MGLYEDKRAWYLQQLAAGDIDSSTSLLTLKKLYLAKTLGDRVIPVWEGDSTQDAVDAAVAAGATRSNPWEVWAYPGAILDHTDTAGVNVVIMDRVIADGEDAELAEPVRVQAPSAVVLRMDDMDQYAGGALNRAYWFTNKAALTLPDPLNAGVQTTLFDYVRRRGIPYTVAVVTDRIGATGGLTEADIRNLVLYGGWEISSHSASHTNPDGTYAGELTEIVDSKAAIDAALNPAAATITGGKCESMIIPGGFTGDYAMDTAAKWNNRAGRLIRKTYRTAQCYNTSRAFTGRPPRYWDSWSYTIGAATTEADIDAMIQRASEPGCVLTIGHHAIVDSGGTGIWANLATWKYLIDSLYAAALAGKLEVVTMTTAKTRLQMGSSPSLFAGGVPYGLVPSDYAKGDDTACLNLTSGGDSQAVLAAIEGDDLTALQALHGWTPGQKVQLLNGTAAGIPKAQWGCWPKQGRRYMILFDAKAPTAGAWKTTVEVERRTGDINGGTYIGSESFVWLSFTPTATWQRFAAPLWMAPEARSVRINVYPDAWAEGHDGKGVEIANVRLQEV